MELSETTEEGYWCNLNEEHKAILQQFKEQFHSWLKDNPKEQEEYQDLKSRLDAVGEHEDAVPLRFLRARKWNLEVSLKLLMDCMSWRANFQGIGVRGITLDSIQNERPKGKAFVHGFDLFGRPIVWISVRLHLKRDSELREVERFCLWIFETTLKSLKGPIETCTSVFSMKGFRLENMDYDFLRFLADLFQSKYPETLGLALVVDCPWIFWGIWNIVKHWIDPHTVKKIKFVNETMLTQYISKETLLTEYGGENPYLFNAD